MKKIVMASTILLTGVCTSAACLAGTCTVPSYATYTKPTRIAQIRGCQDPSSIYNVEKVELSLSSPNDLKIINSNTDTYHETCPKPWLATLTPSVDTYHCW